MAISFNDIINKTVQTLETESNKLEAANVNYQFITLSGLFSE